MPIDRVTFRFEVLRPSDQAALEKGTTVVDNSQGCFVRGLYLEGAGWNFEDAHLQESEHKVLHVQMPII